MNNKKNTTMKHISNFNKAALLFAGILSILSCTNDNDEVNPVPATSKGITSITIGAPSFEAEGATTRIGFTYDNGLKLQWAAGDEITITDASSNTATFRTTTGGGTASFEKISGANLVEGSTYTISYTGSSINNSGKISTEQTQNGNNDLRHLTNNYQATLSNVNSLEDVEFNSTWATSHSGTFKQSACLKLDLTLPINSKLTAIKKVTISATNGGSAKNDFYTNLGNAATNSLTLNFDNLNSINGNVDPYHLIGYIMVGGDNGTTHGGIRYATYDVWNIQVYYGNGENDYLSREIQFNKTGKIENGKLGKVGISNKWKYGWLDYDEASTWTFDSEETATISELTSYSGLYARATSTHTLNIMALKRNGTFSDGTTWSCTARALRLDATDDLSPSTTLKADDACTNSDDRSAALTTTKGGRIYIAFRSEYTNSDPNQARTIDLYFNGVKVVSKDGYTVNQNSGSVDVMEYDANSAGTFVFGGYAKANVCYVKFVPNK